jgi:hypothetical protein
MKDRKDFIVKHRKRYFVLLKVRNMMASDIKKKNVSIGCRKKNDDKKYISYSFVLKVVAEIKYELGFYSFYYYYLLKLDLIFNFDEINNVKIEKHKCNIIKGLVGMNRDTNLLLVEFGRSDEVIRQVYYFIFYFKKNKYFLFLFLDILY